jgi:translation initiation factor 1
MQRAGRGGKEVTVIEQLALTAAEREAWLKDLKSALGCGGVVEDTTLVLQGDHRKRLPPMLAARGVKKVIAGG